MIRLTTLLAKEVPVRSRALPGNGKASAQEEASPVDCPQG